MRKIAFISSLLFVISCGSATRTLMGNTEGNLISTVSIEQNCPKENIEILQKEKGLHGATYALNVCGKRVIYKQVGTIFMESSKTDETMRLEMSLPEEPNILPQISHYIKK